MTWLFKESVERSTTVITINNRCNVIALWQKGTSLPCGGKLTSVNQPLYVFFFFTSGKWLDLSAKSLWTNRSDSSVVVSTCKLSVFSFSTAVFLQCRTVRAVTPAAATAVRTPSTKRRRRKASSLPSDASSAKKRKAGRAFREKTLPVKVSAFTSVMVNPIWIAHGVSVILFILPVASLLL